MLTINDLHQEQELSSFEMGNVAGGTKLTEAEGGLVEGVGDVLKGLGLQGAANVAYTIAGAIYCSPPGACGSHG
jgi:hypothetical protein